LRGASGGAGGVHHGPATNPQKKKTASREASHPGKPTRGIPVLLIPLRQNAANFPGSNATPDLQKNQLIKHGSKSVTTRNPF